MNNNIQGDYLFNDYNNKLYNLDSDESGVKKTLKNEILFEEADKSENVDGFQKSADTKEEEKDAQSVDREDLPEGSSIKDGKIYDKDGNEIGRIEESVKDATGDGKTDSVTQYYLYGEKPEDERTSSAVNKEDLPDGATVKEGVIYDKDGNEIGYTQVNEQDTDGDGVADTVESYFLYD